jgi:hypothetical protein
MNHSDKIFELLGVKPNEEFKIDTSDIHLVYKFTKDFCLRYKDGSNIWQSSVHNIIEFLTGKISIIKIVEITKEDQLVIDYAKLCGFKWLAKDENGETYAYKYKPHKYNGNWNTIVKQPSAPGMWIRYPVSFLSWEDEEPYYIGGDDDANKTE